MSQENEKLIVIPEGIKKYLPEKLKNIDINLNDVNESSKNIELLTSELSKDNFLGKLLEGGYIDALKFFESILKSGIDLNTQILDNILAVLGNALSYSWPMKNAAAQQFFNTLKIIFKSKQATGTIILEAFNQCRKWLEFLRDQQNKNVSNGVSYVKEMLQLAELVSTSEVDLKDETIYEVMYCLESCCLNKISTPDEIIKFLDVLQNICTNEKTSDNAIYDIFNYRLSDWPNPKTIKMQDFPMKKFFSLIQNILSTKNNLSKETLKEMLFRLRDIIYWQKTDIKLVLSTFMDICKNAKNSQQADTIINGAFRGLSGLMGQYKFEIKDVLSMIEEILKSNVVLEGKTVEYILQFVLKIVETQQLQECDLTSIFTLLERTFDKNHKVKGDDIFWIFHQLNRLITNRKICFVQPSNSSATAISSLVDKILESNLEMKDDARENIMLVLLTAIKQKGLLKFYDLKSLVEVIKQNGCNNDNSLTSNNLENIFNALISSIKIGVGDSDKLPIAILEKICNEEENKLTSTKVCCLFDILFELANNPEQMEIYAFSSKEVLTLLQKFLNFDIQLGFDELHTLGCIFGSLLEKMKTGKHIFKCEDVFEMLKKVYQANNDKLTWKKVSQMLDVLWCFIGKPNEYNVEANILKKNLLNLIKEVLNPNVPFDCSCSEDIFLNILPKAIENKIYDVDVVIQMFNDVCNSDNGQFDSYKIDGMVSFILDKVVKQWDKDKAKNFPTDSVLTLAKKILKIETKPYEFRLKSVFETLFLIAKMGDEEKNKIAKMLNDLGMYFEPQDETFVITKIDNSKLKNFVSEKRIAEISKIYKIDDVKQKEQEKKVENEVKTENKSQNQGKLQVTGNDNIHNSNVNLLNINGNSENKTENKEEGQYEKKDNNNMNKETSDKEKEAEKEAREIDNNNNNIQNLNYNSGNPIKSSEKEDNSNSNENENENNGTNGDIVSNNGYNNIQNLSDNLSAEKDKEAEQKSQEIENDNNNIQNLDDDSGNLIEEARNNSEKEDNSNSDENENNDADEESNKNLMDNYFKECRYDSIEILNHLKFNTTNLKHCFQFTNNQISVLDRVKTSLKIWFYMLFHHPLILFFDRNYSLGFHRFNNNDNGKKSISEFVKELKKLKGTKNNNRQSQSEYNKDEKK